MAAQLREEIRRKDLLLSQFAAAAGERADEAARLGGGRSYSAALVTNRAGNAAGAARRQNPSPATARETRGNLPQPPPRVAGVGRLRRKAPFTLRLDLAQGTIAVGPEEVEARLRGAVDPKRDGIRIDRVRKAGDGRVYVDLETRADVDRLRGHEGLRKADIVARDLEGKSPRVVIYDVPADLGIDALREQIVDHNGEALGDRGLHLLRMEANFRFKTGPRGQPTVNWVLEVPAELRAIHRKLGALRLARRRCRVDDFVSLSRCYRCCRLGHVAKGCRHAEACRTCGEDGHQSRDCRAPAGTARCADCRRNGRPWDHACDRTCPAYRVALAADVRRTDYGRTGGKPPDGMTVAKPAGTSTPNGVQGDADGQLSAGATEGDGEVFDAEMQSDA